MRLRGFLKHPLQNFVYRFVQVVGPRPLPKREGAVAGLRQLEIRKIRSYAAHVRYAQTMILEYQRPQAADHSLAKREEP
jgi:hypothetical protein